MCNQYRESDTTSLGHRNYLCGLVLKGLFYTMEILCLPMGGATLVPGYSQEYPTFFFKIHLYIKYTYMYMLCWIYFFIFSAKTQPNDTSNTNIWPRPTVQSPLPPPVVVRLVPSRAFCSSRLLWGCKQAAMEISKLARWPTIAHIGSTQQFSPTIQELPSRGAAVLALNCRCTVLLICFSLNTSN